MTTKTKDLAIVVFMCLLCVSGGFGIAQGLQTLEDQQAQEALDLADRKAYQQLVIDLKVEQEAHVATLKAITRYLNETAGATTAY